MHGVWHQLRSIIGVYSRRVLGTEHGWSCGLDTEIHQGCSDMACLERIAARRVGKVGVASTRHGARHTSVTPRGVRVSWGSRDSISSCLVTFVPG